MITNSADKCLDWKPVGRACLFHLYGVPSRHRCPRKRPNAYTWDNNRVAKHSFFVLPLGSVLGLRGCFLCKQNKTNIATGFNKPHPDGDHLNGAVCRGVAEKMQGGAIAPGHRLFFGGVCVCNRLSLTPAAKMVKPLVCMDNTITL